MRRTGRAILAVAAAIVIVEAAAGALSLLVWVAATAVEEG